MRQLQHVAVLGRFLQDVALASDVADERHHHLFANRIDGRIGDLREQLLEIVEQRLRLVGETGQRRVGAHRTNRLFALRCHRAEDHPQIFIAVSERALAAEKRLGVREVHARGLGQLIDGDLIFFHPLRVGLPRRELLLDLFVRDDAAFDGIDQEHLSRLQAALVLDLLGRDVEHSGFGGHDDQIVMRDDVSSGAQAVAVERCADDAAVGEGDRGGAVPGLHQAGVVLVEGALLRLHVRIARPGFGNQHGHHVRQAASRLKEQLDGVVEVRGIAAVRRDDRDAASSGRRQRAETAAATGGLASS